MSAARRDDVATLAAAERRRRGLPDQRDRDPWAVNGNRWWPSMPGAPEILDLVQELELRAAVEEGNELSIGVAIPGAPGTCATCHHWKVWHKDARWHCELCPCRKWARQVTA